MADPNDVDRWVDFVKKFTSERVAKTRFQRLIPTFQTADQDVAEDEAWKTLE